jgi:starch synthase (maltosyl-transferring)
VVVNLDPFRRQNSMIDVPIELFGQNEGEPYQVHDLLDDSRYTWYGRSNYVELDPVTRPAHIFRLRRFDGALVAR